MEPRHDDDSGVREAVRRAAEAVAGADALVFGAGAGMGVDSGLPDFRGPEGFWNAYPPYRHLGLNFYDLANPAWFRSDPGLAWGFYGHRLGLYRRTTPHPGYQTLKRWADRVAEDRGGLGWFVVTSNIDGHFPRAGFDPRRLVEAHGAIDWMQCQSRCGSAPFPADPFEVEVDESTMRAHPPLPSCPRCGGLARPNVLMFGDFGWDGVRTEAQHGRFEGWVRTLGPDARVAVVECGAGQAVPTIRRACEALARRFDHGVLIRVNVREPEVPRAADISLPLGALDALRAIDECMRKAC